MWLPNEFVLAAFTRAVIHSSNLFQARINIQEEFKKKTILGQTGNCWSAVHPFWVYIRPLMLHSYTCQLSRIILCSERTSAGNQIDQSADSCLHFRHKGLPSLHV